MFIVYIGTQKIHDDFGENLKSFLEITRKKIELRLKIYYELYPIHHWRIAHCGRINWQSDVTNADLHVNWGTLKQMYVHYILSYFMFFLTDEVGLYS